MLKFFSSHCLKMAVAAAALTCTQATVAQQSFPSAPIKYIIGSGPGSSGDAAMRLVLHEAGQELGTTFVIENRTGAGGMIGLDALVNSAPDGYTLGHGNTPVLAILPGFTERAASAVERITPIVPVGYVPSFLSVRAGLPVSSIEELITYAKANPGKLTYGASIGTTGHVGMELFKKLAGVDIMHVPYKSPPAALNDLVSGHIDIGIDNVASSLSLARDKKIKVLGITSPERTELYPEARPVGDTVPGFVSVAFTGVIGPEGMPAEIAQKINQAVNVALKKPNVIKGMNDLGYTLTGGTAQEYTDIAKAERQKWSEVIRLSGARID